MTGGLTVYDGGLFSAIGITIAANGLRVGGGITVLSLGD